MENNNYTTEQNGAGTTTANREELPQFGNAPQQDFGNPANGTRDPLPQFGMGQQPNFGQQFATGNNSREPLPQMNFQVPPPSFEQQQTEQPSNPEVESTVNSAFGKSLAAAIMAWFPICSIIAIFLGSGGLKLVQAAIDRANQLGVQPGGKNVAARVLGMVGKIAGIVMTVIYGIYFIIGIVGISLFL